MKIPTSLPAQVGGFLVSGLVYNISMPPQSDIKPPSLAEIEQALKESKIKSSIPPQSAPVVSQSPVNKDLELEEALKKFEHEQDGKSAPPQSSDVVDVLRSHRPQISHDSETPKIIQWTIRYSGGMIKDERQAEYVLLALVVIMFGLSFYFFFGGNIGKKASPPPDYINPSGMILPRSRSAP